MRRCVGCDGQNAKSETTAIFELWLQHSGESPGSMVCAPVGIHFIHCVNNRPSMSIHQSASTRQRKAHATPPGSVSGSAVETAPTYHNGSANPILERAPPPWHAVLLIAIMSACSIWSLPSLEKLDEIATIETFTTRLFPSLLSIRQLALIRAGIAAVVWGTTVYNLVTPGWEQMTPYLSASKLKMVPNKITGLRTMYPFTSW
jgi:hypothetical protein